MRDDHHVALAATSAEASGPPAEPSYVAVVNMPYGDLVAASRHHASVAVVAELFAPVVAGRPMAHLPPWAKAGSPA